MVRSWYLETPWLVSEEQADEEVVVDERKSDEAQLVFP